MYPHYLSALASLALVGLSSAQMIHNITVGGNGTLTFQPNFINAALGDIVQFVFVAKNHTATQSSFNTPCAKLIGADGVSLTGFDSGFEPIDANGDVRVSSFQVATTNPLWFYCRQTGHCAQGMVFAVNPPTSGNTFNQFLQNALGTASSTTSAPPATSTSSSSMTTVTTSAPPVSVVTVTQTITLGGTSTWTTTYGSYPGSPEPTPNLEPVVHTVQVGQNGTLTFSPNTVSAQPRDIIMFEFLAKNHTATQSSFADPCSPLAGTSTGSAGFDSGFEPVTNVTGLTPKFFNVTVNDTAPIWVYCKQTVPASHCAAGMVFAVNPPPSGNTFQAFQQKAMQSLNGSNTNGTGLNSTTGGGGQGGGAMGGVSVDAGVWLGVAGGFAGAILGMLAI